MSANFAYYIDIVGTCNLRCPSCPTGNFLPPDFTSVPRPTGTMSPELFREIALKIAKHQNPCDTFLGLYNYGEPLLHPKLTKILEISNELNFSPHISTAHPIRNIKRKQTTRKKVFCPKLSCAKFDKLQIWKKFHTYMTHQPILLPIH